MSDIKTSIIIPVYNVEAYLAKCIESAIRQETKKTYEIILVDDGSTDESGAICDRYAFEDERIIVIHQNNQGLGYARNSGIKVARGEWILFVDSDDWILPNTLDDAVNLVETSNTDMGCFQYVRTKDRDYEYARTTGSPDDYVEVISKEEALHRYLLNMSRSACTKIYKRDIFDIELFSNVALHEDSWSMHLFIEQCNNVVLTNQILYVQYAREQSLTTSVFSEKNMIQLTVGQRIIDFYQEKYPAYIGDAYASAIRGALALIKKLLIEAKFYQKKNWYFCVVKHMRALLLVMNNKNYASERYCSEIKRARIICRIPIVYAVFIRTKKCVYRNIIVNTGLEDCYHKFIGKLCVKRS